MGFSNLRHIQFALSFSQRLYFFACDPEKVLHFKIDISNLIEILSVPKQEERRALFLLDGKEKRRSHFIQSFILKAEARVWRGFCRKKKEASELGVGQGTLVEMTDHSPLIQRTKREC